VLHVRVDGIESEALRHPSASGRAVRGIQTEGDTGERRTEPVMQIAPEKAASGNCILVASPSKMVRFGPARRFLSDSASL